MNPKFVIPDIRYRGSRFLFPDLKVTRRAMDIQNKRNTVYLDIFQGEEL